MPCLVLLQESAVHPIVVQAEVANVALHMTVVVEVENAALHMTAQDKVPAVRVSAVHLLIV